MFKFRPLNMLNIYVAITQHFNRPQKHVRFFLLIFESHVCDTQC